MANVVFGLMAFAQMVRLVIRPEVLVAGYTMPLWPSVLALIILGGLSFWMWVLAGSATKGTNPEPCGVTKHCSRRPREYSCRSHPRSDSGAL